MTASFIESGPGARNGVDTVIQYLIERPLRSQFARANFLLTVLIGSRADELTRSSLSKEKSKTNRVFGRQLPSEAKQMLDGQGTTSEIRYQNAELDDSAAVEPGGVTPTASGFAEDNTGTMRMHWTDIEYPFKVRKSTLEDATGKAGIVNALDEAAAMTMEVCLKSQNTLLWNGTLTGANQGSRRWSQYLGIKHVLTANNTYGEVDRSSETVLNPVEIDASTLSTTVISTALVDTINIIGDPGDSTHPGMASKDPMGIGCDLFITTQALFNKVKTTVEANGTYYHPGTKIPDIGPAGIKYPVIQVGNSYITYDPNAASGTMYCLNTHSWIFELDRRANFKAMPLTDKSKYEEGGGAYLWSKVRVKGRLKCVRPWLQARIYGLTTS